MIIDIGTGTGSMLRTLWEKEFKNLLGIDVDDKTQEFQSMEISFIQGDIHSLLGLHMENNDFCTGETVQKSLKGDIRNSNVEL